MPLLFAVLIAFLTLAAGDIFAQAKLEMTEVDAWLVRDPQMSSQFAVADQMGYFKAEGLKINPRWYIAGTDLPSMWGAGNIHLGTATATMVVPIAASGQAIYNIAPQSDIAGAQQIILGKRGQEIVRSPKDLEKIKIGMPKGASVTMALQAMAKDTGVDFSKLQFVNLAPPDCVTALAKGDIDAMAGWAPWVFNAVKQAGGKFYFSGNTGYLGRIGIYEILRMTREVKRHIQDRTDIAAVTQAGYKEGMRPLRVSGATKIAQGLTTFEEVLKSAPLP